VTVTVTVAVSGATGVITLVAVNGSDGVTGMVVLSVPVLARAVAVTSAQGINVAAGVPTAGAALKPVAQLAIHNVKSKPHRKSCILFAIIPSLLPTSYSRIPTPHNSLSHHLMIQ
jgi:hypothetical protein